MCFWSTPFSDSFNWHQNLMTSLTQKLICGVTELVSNLKDVSLHLFNTASKSISNVCHDKLTLADSASRIDPSLNCKHKCLESVCLYVVWWIYEFSRLYMKTSVREKLTVVWIFHIFMLLHGPLVFLCWWEDEKVKHIRVLEVNNR